MVHRLKSPTPKFWKKVRGFGLSLLAGGTAIVALKTTMSIPEIYSTVATHLMIVGTVIAAMAQATKTGE